MKSIRKPLAAFLCLTVVMAAAMGLAAFYQTDFGKIDVSAWYFETDGGDACAYKLYVPQTATADTPAPAVLLFHGYQNDKDTSSTYALELARRGIVAMCFDSYGHGDTTVGMRARGYATRKLPGWDKEVSGPERFLVMMSFSTNDFFTLEGVQESSLDSSMGGRLALEVLLAMPFVDAENIGFTGHSMGTWSSWSTAASYPKHKAVVLQCGELFPESYYDSDTVKFNNVLLLQAKYDEFNMFLDYTLSTDGLMETPLRYHDFALQSGPIDWDTTYGDFADGTARRIQLLENVNHRLTTVSHEGIAATVSWFAQAFGISPAISPDSQIGQTKELFLLIGTLAALLSALPLMLLLLRIPFFASAARPLPDNKATLLPKKRWYRAALISILISAVTYPFITQLGHGLFPYPESVFRMTVGNGIILWFFVLALIALWMLRHWMKKGEGKRLGATLSDLGAATADNPGRLPWAVIGKSALVALLLFLWVYACAALFQALWHIDFRYVWPLFRPFGNAVRLGQFALYLPFYLFFFVISGGVKLFGQLRQPRIQSPFAEQLVWWLKSVLVMLGGLLIVALVEYVPFFLGAGPGMNILFTSTFGGPMISFLIVIIPQFILLFFLATYCYRKTGLVYIGSFLLSLLGCWAVTGGSSFF